MFIWLTFGVLHLIPVNPGWQSHRYPLSCPGLSKHSPLLSHLFCKQSLTYESKHNSTNWPIQDSKYKQKWLWLIIFLSQVYYLFFTMSSSVSWCFCLAVTCIASATWWVICTFELRDIRIRWFTTWVFSTTCNSSWTC